MLVRVIAALCAAGVICAAPANAESAKLHKAKVDSLRPASIETGMASIYCFRNGPTASGERSRPVVLTAAHKTLPFGTLVEVTNQKNGRSIVVRINDRGPFISGRVIDLTPAGARALKFDGVAPVALRVLNHRRDLHLAERAI